jgi:SAM-dependent methyltransferase
MGAEINLMEKYPRAKRNVEARGQQKTAEDRALAREFGKAFFDGSRDHGYGGFSYNPKYWQPVIPDFQKHYQLNEDSAVLDIGCAKGFMLHDLQELIPGITVKGLDISEYAIDHAMESVRPDCQTGCATALPFEDNAFDLVIAITTMHNLERDDLARALLEVERVKRKYSFITVDAYRNDEERERMEAWNLTAKTMMHVDEWKQFFKEVGYTGDYYWFIP